MKPAFSLLLALTLSFGLAQCGKSPSPPPEVTGQWLMKKFQVTDGGEVVYQPAIETSRTYVVSFADGKANFSLTAGLSLECNQFTYSIEFDGDEHGYKMILTPVAAANCPVGEPRTLGVSQSPEGNLQFKLNSYFAVWLPIKTAEFTYSLQKIDPKVAEIYAVKKPIPAIVNPLRPEAFFALDKKIHLSALVEGALQKSAEGIPSDDVFVDGKVIQDPWLQVVYAEPVCQWEPNFGFKSRFQFGKAWRLKTLSIASAVHPVTRIFVRVPGIPHAGLKMELVQIDSNALATVACWVPAQMTATGKFEVSHFFQSLGTGVQVK